MLRRSRAVLMAMLGTWLLTGPAFAQLVSTDLNGSAADVASVTVTLTWPQPTGLQVEQPDGELILRFDQPLDYSAFASLAPRIAKWAVSAFLGYDSLVLKLAPGVVARVTTIGSQVLVTLTDARAPIVETTQPPQSAGLRLQFLKAGLLWSMGEPWEASALLAQMSRNHPEHLDILAAQSSVETRLERWRQASAYRDHANRLQGLASRDDLPLPGTEHAPRAQVDWLHDTQDGTTTRDGLRASGHAFLAPGLRLAIGYDYTHVQAEAASIVAPVLAKTGGVAHLATAGLRYDLTSGGWLAGRAIGSVPEVGGGIRSGAAIEGGKWDPWGTTRLTMALREPRWDLPVLAGLAATRDAVGLTRTMRSWGALGRPLLGDIAAQFSAQLERWSAARAGGTATDIAGSASLQYVSWRARPRLTSAYTIQHLHALQTAAGPASPLTATLTKSHIHTWILGAQAPLWQWLGVDGFAGYGVSYWGPDSAQFGGGLAWSPPSGFRALVRYQRGLAPSPVAGVTTALTVQAGGTF